MDHPEAQNIFLQWESQLIDMIEYSEDENWAIRK